MLGISDYTAGRVSAKTCPEIQQEREEMEFGVGDLVLRRVVGNTWDINARKLAPTWKGPYRVTSIAGMRVYYLEDLDERPLPRLWNAHNLKKFYH